jgi:hypothetical protein
MSALGQKQRFRAIIRDACFATEGLGAASTMRMENIAEANGSKGPGCLLRFLPIQDRST